MIRHFGTVWSLPIAMYKSSRRQFWGYTRILHEVYSFFTLHFIKKIYIAGHYCILSHKNMKWWRYNTVMCPCVCMQTASTFDTVTAYLDFGHEPREKALNSACIEPPCLHMFSLCLYCDAHVHLRYMYAYLGLTCSTMSPIESESVASFIFA